MKLIIAGSRNIILSPTRACHILDTITQRHFPNVTEVVSGTARGADYLGELWAARKGIPVKQFPVTEGEWRILGKRAGHARNAKMADYVARSGEKGGCIALWDSKSRGTYNMIENALERKIPTAVIEWMQGQWVYRLNVEGESWTPHMPI